MADVVYHNFFLQIMTKTMDLGVGGDVFKLALFTGSKVIEVDDITYSNTNEVSGDGYSEGGYLFTNTNNSITDDDGNNWTIFDIAEDATWAAATITARYAQLYNSTVTNKLICCFDFGADKSSTAGTFKVTFNASGVLKLS